MEHILELAFHVALNILKMSSSIIDCPVLTQRLHFNLENRGHCLFIFNFYNVLVSRSMFPPSFICNTMRSSQKGPFAGLVLKLVSKLSCLAQYAS